MARKRRKQLSVGRILALKPGQIEKMTSKELRKITTFLNSAANKRLKRAAQLGTESEVLRKAQEGGRFKTTRITPKMEKEMGEAQARSIAYSEFMRVREFLKKETSSTRGVKKTQKKIIRKFKQKVKKLGIDLDKKDEGMISVDPYTLSAHISEKDLNDLVWTQVDKLGETKALTKQDRYRAAGEAYEVLMGELKTKDELFTHLQDWADQQYIADVEKQVEYSDEEIDKYFGQYMLSDTD